MRDPLFLRTAFAVGVLTVAATGQRLVFAEGTPTFLRIATVPENAPNTPDTVVLNDAELLPIEMTGRTIAHELDVTMSRRIERNGLVRLELPDGGRLFRYSRSSGAFWGFLHVAANGDTRVVIEAPGEGPTGTDDPFVDRVAIADDAQHAAVAFTNGDIHVLRLDGGVYASTGRADRRVANDADPIPASMRIGPSALWYLAKGPTGNVQRLWRVGLADGAVTADVSPPAVANGDFKDHVVMSRDGAHVVCLYGPQQQQRLWHCGLTGVATVLPPLASKYEDAGFLPDGPGEPAMLLSDDGSRLFYVDADVRDELFLLDVTGQLPTFAMTADTVFQPYIGVHILPKFAANSLVVAIGDVNLMDWFKASLQPQGGVVDNLTATGSPIMPFPAGALVPVTAASVGGELLAVEQTAGTTSLRRIVPATGATVTVATDLVDGPQPGSSTTTAADVLVRTAAGDALFDGVAGTPLVTLPPDLLLTTPVRGPDFQGTFLHLAVGVGVPLFYAPFGLVTLPLEFGLQQIAMTPQGGVVLVGGTVRYLALGTYEVLNRPSVPFRACLSGAGG